MPSKQVEDVYDAGGFDGGPLGRTGSVENRQDGRAAEAKAWRDALEVAAKVAERRIAAGRAESIPVALRNLML